MILQLHVVYEVLGSLQKIESRIFLRYDNLDSLDQATTAKKYSAHGFEKPNSNDSNDHLFESKIWASLVASTLYFDFTTFQGWFFLLLIKMTPEQLQR